MESAGRGAPRPRCCRARARDKKACPSSQRGRYRPGDRRRHLLRDGRELFADLEIGLEGAQQGRKKVVELVPGGRHPSSKTDDLVAVSLRVDLDPLVRRATMSDSPPAVSEPPVEAVTSDLARASLDSARSAASSSAAALVASTTNGDATSESNGTDDPPATSREAELAAQLAQIQAEKETLEGQYRGLLSKLTTMRSTLGDKLKQDAVRASVASSLRIVVTPRPHRTSSTAGPSRSPPCKPATTTSPTPSRRSAASSSTPTPTARPPTRSSTC